jgi:hypothetical protein
VHLVGTIIVCYTVLLLLFSIRHNKTQETVVHGGFVCMRLKIIQFMEGKLH